MQIRDITMKKLGLLFLVFFSTTALATKPLVNEKTFINRAMSYIYFTDIQKYQSQPDKNTLSRYTLEKQLGDFIDLDTWEIEKRFSISSKDADTFFKGKTVSIRRCSVVKKEDISVTCREAGSLELPIHPKISFINRSPEDEDLSTEKVHINPVICKYQGLSKDGPMFSECIFLSEQIGKNAFTEEFTKTMLDDENLQKILRKAYSNLELYDHIMISSKKWPEYFFTDGRKKIIEAARQLGFDMPILNE